MLKNILVQKSSLKLRTVGRYMPEYENILSGLCVCSMKKFNLTFIVIQFFQFEKVLSMELFQNELFYLFKLLTFN